MSMLSSSSHPVIAVIEDEPDILDLICLHLKEAHFSCQTFTQGISFLHALPHASFDLIVLDLMLPDIDGLEICRQLKSREAYMSIPILILSAKGKETDRIIGLELGADDYMTKPFSPRELVARVRAILRRNSPGKESTLLHLSDILSIDSKKYEVYVKGQKVDLTTTEFRILKRLADRKGWYFSREQILEFLWKGEKSVIDRSVDVHINRLRKKLGKAGKYIQNKRGVGYRFET